MTMKSSSSTGWWTSVNASDNQEIGIAFIDKGIDDTIQMEISTETAAPPLLPSSTTSHIDCITTNDSSVVMNGTDLSTALLTRRRPRSYDENTVQNTHLTLGYAEKTCNDTNANERVIRMDPSTVHDVAYNDHRASISTCGGQERFENYKRADKARPAASKSDNFSYRDAASQRWLWSSSSSKYHPRNQNSLRHSTHLRPQRTVQAQRVVDWSTKDGNNRERSRWTALLFLIFPATIYFSAIAILKVIQSDGPNGIVREDANATALKPLTVILDQFEKQQRFKRFLPPFFPPSIVIRHGRLYQDYVKRVQTWNPLYHFLDDRNYGDLDIESLHPLCHLWSSEHTIDVSECDYPSRTILVDDINFSNEEREAWIEEWDEEQEIESYYEPLDTVDPVRDCQRPQWAYQSFPVCNIFHELQLEETSSNSHYDIKYLAHGYWRDAWLFDPHRDAVVNDVEWSLPIEHSDGEDSCPNREQVDLSFVLKHLRINNPKLDFDYYTIHAMHQEAMVMERLSASPFTTNIYGYCATSLMVQTAQELTWRIVPYVDTLQSSRGRIDQEVLDDLESAKGGVVSLNNFTIEEKLILMTAMAESLAEMHGFRGGVMVNDDVHPDQWLITDSGRVLLNDMNNAVALDWNEKENHYCKYWTVFGGDFRAPEEYVGGLVDETADIWAVGNMIFSLLTGLWPYYDEEDEQAIQQITMEGIAPYINPGYASRSLIERRMVELMERCHQLDPADRVDIFYVVDHLRKTASLHHHEKKHAL